MALLSLDELLEQLLRAVYKDWYSPGLVTQQAAINALRDELASQLEKTLDESSADAPEVSQVEVVLSDFVDALAELPAITEIEPALWQNRPSTGAKLLKQTDASVPRLHELVALLRADNPAIYILSTMHYLDWTPRPALGPPPSNQLISTLSNILRRLTDQWDELSPGVQQQVRNQVETLGRLTTSGAMIEKERVLDLLLALEKMPDVVSLALPQFVKGKVDDPLAARRSGSLDGELVVGARLLSAVASVQTLSTRTALESLGGGTKGFLPPGNTQDENNVHFQSAVDFPAQVAPESETPLVVRLVLPQPESFSFDATISFDDPKQPEIIEVVLSMPGFQERTKDFTRLIKVFSDQDSQPAVFLLQASSETGTYVVTIDYNHRGRLVGSAKYEVEITEQPAAVPGPLQRISQPTALEPLPGHPPDPADLELRVVKDPQSNELRFILHSEDASLGYNRRPMGSIVLAGDPRHFLADTFQRLSGFAGRATAGVDDAFLEEVQNEIIAIGEELFGSIFPKELQKEYWRLKELRQEERVHTLLIVSDEPWIPWELVKPFDFDSETNEARVDDFLASAFRTSRWLADRGLGAHMQIQAAELVAPNLDLPFVQRERDYFMGLSALGLQLGEILRTRQDFLNKTSSGVFQLMHVAAHGKFDAANADAAPIILHNRETVLPRDLAGRRSLALRQQRPLVFLNTCHSGQIDFTLTGLGGWAERMVNDIGVSAFVGTLWEVQDELAAEFAQMFYNTLQQEQTLAEAFHAAREHIRALQPANPTWLAYTLYGDPNSRVRWGNG